MNLHCARRRHDRDLHGPGARGRFRLLLPLRHSYRPGFGPRLHARPDPNGAGCQPFQMTGPLTIMATFLGPQTLTIQTEVLENGVGDVLASSTGGMNLSCPGVAGSIQTCTTHSVATPSPSRPSRCAVGP